MTNIRNANIDDCDEIGLITVTASHSAFIGVVPEQLLDFSWTPAVSANNWRASFESNTDRGQIFRVAEQDGQLQGFIWCTPWGTMDGFDACIQGLYVLPTAQRQGLGRQLISDSVTGLLTRGHRQLEISCVEVSPSCDFYRHLGGREIARRPVQVDRFDTAEIVFGWDDMSCLK